MHTPTTGISNHLDSTIHLEFLFYCNVFEWNGVIYRTVYCNILRSILQTRQESPGKTKFCKNSFTFYLLKFDWIKKTTNLIYTHNATSFRIALNFNFWFDAFGARLHYQLLFGNKIAFDHMVVMIHNIQNPWGEITKWNANCAFV